MCTGAYVCEQSGPVLQSPGDLPLLHLTRLCSRQGTYVPVPTPNTTVNVLITRQKIIIISQQEVVKNV